MSGQISIIREGRMTASLVLSLGALFVLAGSNSTLMAQYHKLGLLPPQTKEVTTTLILTSPSDANFDRLLESYFPGVLDVPAFQTIRPYLVLIRMTRRSLPQATRFTGR